MFHTCPLHILLLTQSKDPDYKHYSLFKTQNAGRCFIHARSFVKLKEQKKIFLLHIFRNFIFTNFNRSITILWK